jgi:hypothetical protein
VGRLTALGAVAVVVSLALVASAGGALEARLSISPKGPAALEPTQVVLRTYAPLIRADGSCCRLVPYAARTYPFRVEAVSPSGNKSRIRVRWARENEFRGVFRFPSSGRWEIQLPQFRQSIAVQVRPPVPTPAPAGFAPLGQPRCEPASPADRSSRSFRDIFGTAIGGEELWALPFLPKGATWARTDAAVFDGLVGKEVKIVFGMTTFHRPLRAIGPNGESASPVWGPTLHGGSNWIRQPGSEWGAGFVFPEPGCWRIRVGSRGDVWMLLRS